MGQREMKVRVIISNQITEYFRIAETRPTGTKLDNPSPDRNFGERLNLKFTFPTVTFVQSCSLGFLHTQLPQPAYASAKCPPLLFRTPKSQGRLECLGQEAQVTQLQAPGYWSSRADMYFHRYR